MKTQHHASQNIKNAVVIFGEVLRSEKTYRPTGDLPSVFQPTGRGRFHMDRGLGTKLLLYSFFC
jgi:hypothetical protein